MQVDIARLTDSERRLLLLLAQGHTAKSIAAVEGLSENAVNERLREARRKTGAASSRELARQVHAATAATAAASPQENRDAKIGMALGTQADPALHDVGGKKAAQRWSTGAIAMTSFILGGSVFAAILIGVGQTVPAIPATAPRVVATTPGSDARIAPGRLVISVTFDQPMRRNSYSFVETGQGRYPDCDRTPRQSADRRSFTLNCRIEPGQSYAIGFNGRRFRNFVGANGVPAEPSSLRFSS